MHVIGAKRVALLGQQPVQLAIAEAPVAFLRPAHPEFRTLWQACAKIAYHARRQRRKAVTRKFRVQTITAQHAVFVFDTVDQAETPPCGINGARDLDRRTRVPIAGGNAERRFELMQWDARLVQRGMASYRGKINMAIGMDRGGQPCIAFWTLEIFLREGDIKNHCARRKLRQCLKQVGMDFARP
jgi:hypothetical protein